MRVWRLIRNRIIILAAAVIVLAAVAPRASRGLAQTPPNLLGNPGMEGPYFGQGVPNQTVPQGWTLWLQDGSPESLPASDRAHSGGASWALKLSGNVFTAAGYQQVTATPGAVLRGSAYAQAFTCSDRVTACAITEPPYHQSDQTAGVELRVGIDPTGGSDPLAANVKWSPTVTAYNAWTEISVTATAETATVTLFLYATQAQGLTINEVYWDDAALIVTEFVPPASTPTATSRPAATPTVTPSPTPTITVTPTPTQLAVADAAPELVAEGGELCVSIFDDANTNGQRDEGENLLSAAFDLIGPDGSAQPYTFSGTDEAQCLVLIPAQYQVRVRFGATAGPTTPTQLATLLTRGSRIALVFGGTADYQPPTPPPGASATLETETDGIAAPLVQANIAADTSDSMLDRLYERSGYYVLALAGVLALGSVLLLIYLNRPRGY